MLRRPLGIFALHCLRRLYSGLDGEALLASVSIFVCWRGSYLSFGMPF